VSFARLSRRSGEWIKSEKAFPVIKPFPDIGTANEIANSLAVAPNHAMSFGKRITTGNEKFEIIYRYLVTGQKRCGAPDTPAPPNIILCSVRWWTKQAPCKPSSVFDNGLSQHPAILIIVLYVYDIV
jgi:hypothetical protein